MFQDSMDFVSLFILPPPLAVYYKHRFGGPTRDNLQLKLAELKEAVDLADVDTQKLLSEFDLSFQDAWKPKYQN